MEDGIRIKGTWYLLLRRKSGEEVNLVVGNSATNAGKAEIAGLIVSDISGTAFDYIAIGTGTGTAAVTDTALGTTETARSSVTGTRTTTTVTNDTAQYVTTFGFAGANAVTEVGIFNTSSSATTGDMLARQTYAALNVAAGDTLQVTYKVVVS